MKTNFLHKKGWYPHTINIETKDNRFKYVITVSLYYSIGTGEMHSVEEFAKKAFKHVNLNFEDYLEQDKNLLRPTEVDTLLADYSKAKKILKWKPKVLFDDLIVGMVESDLEFVTKHGY